MSEELNIGNGNFIFLAEDDLDDQELLTEAFKNCNKSIVVHAVTNGKKAVAFLENLPDEGLPCLIVLDFNLPEVNGSEILKSLGADKRFENVPKVVWSTSNSPMYRQLCLGLGACAYFVKPADISGIENLAKEMLGFCDITEK